LCGILSWDNLVFLILLLINLGDQILLRWSRTWCHIEWTSEVSQGESISEEGISIRLT
jgi:hypothetical protein